jgi:hypothetical protein
VIDYGIYENLAGQQGPSIVACPQGSRGGKVAARAASRDDQPFGRDSPFGGALRGPPKRIRDVIEWAWIWRLRRKAVIDVDHDRRHVPCQVSADSVMHVQITEDPSSSVHVDDHDARLGTVIDPYRNVERGVLVDLPHRNGTIRQPYRATYAVQVLLPTA